MSNKQQNLTTARKATMQDMYFFFGLTEDEIAEVEAGDAATEKGDSASTKSKPIARVDRSISSQFRRSRR